MTTKKKYIMPNVNKNTRQVPVRWPHQMLDDSKQLAEELGESWTDFVKTAVQERIDRVKAEKEKQ